jgi:hypothetical protein
VIGAPSPLLSDNLGIHPPRLQLQSCPPSLDTRRICVYLRTLNGIYPLKLFISTLMQRRIVCQKDCMRRQPILLRSPFHLSSFHRSQSPYLSRIERPPVQLCSSSQFLVSTVRMQLFVELYVLKNLLRISREFSYADATRLILGQHRKLLLPLPVFQGVVAAL